MLNNFHYAMSLAQTLYDIEGDMEDMEEIGLIEKRKRGGGLPNIIYVKNFVLESR